MSPTEEDPSGKTLTFNVLEGVDFGRRDVLV